MYNQVMSNAYLAGGRTDAPAIRAPLAVGIVGRRLKGHAHGGHPAANKTTHMSSLQQRRIFAMRRIANELQQSSGGYAGDRDLYQFGVLTGGGLRAWVELMPLLNVSFGGAIWGFDSFNGMPDEDKTFMRKSHQRDSQWAQGGLNASSIMRAPDWPALRHTLTRNVGYARDKTHFVRGFYNDSLREGARLARRTSMRPAFLIDIDCDLYTSTKQALSFMLVSGLLVPGTYVYYDDYSLKDWSFPPTKYPYKEERLAHAEVTAEFDLTWKTVYRYGERYPGPIEELRWVTQFPAADKGRKVLSKDDLNPVLRLEKCGRCPGLPHRHAHTRPTPES